MISLGPEDTSHSAGDTYLLAAQVDTAVTSSGRYTWARRVNPLMADLLRYSDGQAFAYYWVTDQAEFATDVLFRDRQSLSGLYPALLEHATLAFGSEDVLRFLSPGTSKPATDRHFKTGQDMVDLP